MKFAEILKARYEKDAQTYSVEIEINPEQKVWTGMNMCDDLTGETKLCAPRTVLDVICKALDIFPKEEMGVAAN